MYEVLMYDGGVYRVNELYELIEDVGGFVIQKTQIQVQILVTMAIPEEERPVIDKKTVELGRALSMSPELLLLDEPSSGLNVEETEDLSFWVTDIKEELGITVLLVEHNMRFVQEVSDTVLALDFGQVITQGSPKEVLHHPEVMKAYLGE